MTMIILSTVTTVNWNLMLTMCYTRTIRIIHICNTTRLWTLVIHLGLGGLDDLP